MKKTKLFFIVIFLHFLIFNCSAQSPRLWATYYGGTSLEYGQSVATDKITGDVYLAGRTQSASGIASGGFQNTFGGGSYDSYLVKFNAAGVRLWATYYGELGEDDVSSVTTDASGNVYLTGVTSSTSGIASGGFQNTYGGGIYDGYLVKFNSAGTRLWATYYGGTDLDAIFGVTTDVSGNVYLTGRTESTSGIASGGFQNTPGGVADAFLVKFNSAGTRLWGTYYGGINNDIGYGVTTDALGNVYMSGRTTSVSGIASGGFQNAYGGGASFGDAFLVKFNSAGVRQWATYYGGAGEEDSQGLATDASGNVYMEGYTTSVSGIASGGFQNTYGGGAWDAMLVKFSSAGVRLWATYYGGTDYDDGYSVATDATGVYLAGATASNSGIASGGFQDTYGGNYDAYLVKFDFAGIRQCATYYGGTGGEYFPVVATDASGNVYMEGPTASDSSIASGGFQNTFGGINDGYLVKFSNSCSSTILPVAAFSASDTMICAGTCINFTDLTTSFPTSWNWTFTGGTPDTSTQQNPIICYNVAGNYDVRLIAGNGNGSDTITKTLYINVLAPPIVTVAPVSATICSGTSDTLVASGASTYTWSPATGLNTTTGNTVIASPSATTIYTVTGTDLGCTGTASVSITVGPTTNANAGNDTAVCSGSSVNLMATGGSVYAWSPATGLSCTNCQNPIASPATTTTYTVAASSGTCTPDTDEVTITVTPLPVITVNNPVICIGDSVILTANGATTYSWSGGLGSGNPVTVSPTTTTTYFVTGTSSGCTGTSSSVVIVNPIPVASISGDTLICAGTQTILTASGGTSYLWDTSANTQSITVNPTSASTYTVTVSNGGCVATTGITINTLPNPTANTGNDTTINLGSSAQLNGTGGFTFSWSPTTDISCTGCANPLVSPQITTTYILVVTDTNGCTDTDTVTVYVEFECGDALLPNAFSPNNDGHNDAFCLPGWANCIREFKILIFDRWGEKVFESDDVSFHWDGASASSATSRLLSLSKQAHKENSAVFVYYIKATNIDGTLITRKGNISLIR